MRYYEDLAVGATFRTGSATLTEEEVFAFARQFDPQPFHLDAEAAAASVFGGLAASGWHTVAVTMRLIVEGELKLAGGVVGLGIDGIQWLRAVRPGDQISAVTEVVAMRVSRSRSDRGIVTLRTTTYNQRGEEVQIMVSQQLVPRREAPEHCTPEK